MICDDCFDEGNHSSDSSSTTTDESESESESDEEDSDDEDDDGEVEVTGSRTREERDAELRANAVDLTEEDAGSSGVVKDEDPGTSVKAEKDVKVKVEAEEPTTQPSDRKRGMPRPTAASEEAANKRIRGE